MVLRININSSGSEEDRAAKSSGPTTTASVSSSASTLAERGLSSIIPISPNIWFCPSTANGTFKPFFVRKTRTFPLEIR